MTGVAAFHPTPARVVTEVRMLSPFEARSEAEHHAFVSSTSSSFSIGGGPFT
jgi:hypothetical protein